jgi:hypothetical protein
MNLKDQVSVTSNQSVASPFGNPDLGQSRLDRFGESSQETCLND